MPSSTTEAIKEKLDVVEYLRGYLQLHAAGKNFKALCPFHKERTPSFMISPDRQSWHCFGCGIGGDIFGFLMRYENLEFAEALRVLAEKAGVELRRLDPAEHKYTGLLYELNNAAKDFFKKSLVAFAPAKKYLAERGLKPEIIEEFELGWAPQAPEELTMRFLNSGYAPDDIVRAGLAIKTERGLLLDRFRGRIMFPIHNHFGKVVGFTGRILPTPSGVDEPQFEAAKYVNSPETPIFQKSHLLYGLWKTKNFIRDAGAAFLVEGQMDFLMSSQAGIKNVVATSGTALTADHLRALRRLAEELILSFDSDSAGSAASERAIDLAEAADFGVKVAKLKGFKDPAEAAQAGAENLTSVIKSAVPAPAFYFEKYLPRAGAADYGRRENLKNIRLVLAKIKNIPSAVMRAYWLKELARRSGIEEKILVEEAEKIKSAGTKDEIGEGQAVVTDSGRPKEYSRRELIGEELLRAALAKDSWSFMDDCLPYLARDHKRIFEILRAGGKRSDDPALDEAIDFIVLGSAKMDDKEIDDLKKELLKEYYKDKKRSLALAVRRAEVEGDEAGLRSAMEELSKIPAQVFES